MKQGRTTSPEWELRRLRAIVDGRFVAAREEALREYLLERERRRRYARVRDRRDRERRTLVGAHMSRDKAEYIRWLANMEGISVTKFVELALRQAIERSDTYRGR